VSTRSMWGTARSITGGSEPVQPSGADQQKKVGDLSGGERNRLHLAKLLSRAGMSCSWTSRRLISTSTRCVRWKKRCSGLRNAWW